MRLHHARSARGTHAASNGRRRRSWSWLLTLATLLLINGLAPPPRAVAADVRDVNDDVRQPHDTGTTAATRRARQLDFDRLSQLEMGEQTALPEFELSDGRRADLELERFEVLTPDAQILAGDLAGDTPLPRPNVVLLRGTVNGDPASRVYFGVSRFGTHGFVRLHNEMEIVSTGPSRPAVADNFAVEITNALDLGPAPNAGTPCATSLGIPELFPDGVPLLVPPALNPLGDPLGSPADGAPPCRTARIAVDTDWEFTGNLFGGNTAAATAYITTLFGAVSEIYVDNFNTTITIPYVRVWPNSSDPYSANTDTLAALLEFKAYWNANHAGVQRELAHLLTAKNLGGGIAYVGVVCNTSWGYGVSANLNGTFPYPLQDHHWQNWDIVVVAHELGHNFGTGHTHEYSPAIDGCGNGDCSSPHGGTIMSYCHTCAPGMSNIVLEFHPTVKTFVLNWLDAHWCDITESCADPEPPTIGSLTADADPVTRGSGVLLTANGVADLDGTITHVRFYHDTNDDGALDGGDALLATDSSVTGGWTHSASTSSLALGVNRFFAQATDNDALTSTAAALTVTVTDPGVYTGPAGGSWFVPGHWSGGAIPNGTTDVTISDHVRVDGMGAVASTITVASGGTLELSNDAATLMASHTIVSAGAALTGMGVITGDVTNHGTVAPGLPIRALVVSGTFTQSATGTLAIDVDGYIPGISHDVLTGTTVVLDGALTVTATPTIIPLLQSLDFIIAGSVTGTFATTSLPADLPGTFSFAVEYDAQRTSLLTLPFENCSQTLTALWTTSVIDFSSQYSPNQFSAARATGAPDVLVYGNDANAWAPDMQDGTFEYITLGVDTLLHATGVTVRETWGNGGVYRVDVVDIDDQLTTVWTGVDPSAPGAPEEFFIQWPATEFLVKGVRVYVDTDTTTDWEEIDAVRLHGIPGPQDQWANSVLGFSSQWSPTIFSADQTLGVPDVFTYGNNSSAWAPATQDGTQETITVGFATPVFAEGVTVRETWGNGFVRRLDVIDMADASHTVWSGTDSSRPGTPSNFRVNFDRTAFLVKGVRVHVDTDATTDWEEIDAIQLHGVSDTSLDCNDNGVIDACDIALGTSTDANADGVPDECDFAPNVATLVAAPLTVNQNLPVTLTATGVTDPDGDVSIVRFYHDVNDDGARDGGDTLLGSDASAAGGWTWTGSTSAFTVGTVRLFAQPTDAAGLIGPATPVLITVETAHDPGVYVGAPGASWFVSSNWGGNAVPGSGTDVVIPDSVTIDASGAVAATVTIQDGGALTFDSGALTVASGLTIETGGTLTGTGIITGNVVNAGTVAPGSDVGTLLVSGTYTQSSSGSLAIDVDGYTPSTQHDVLTIGGASTLAGTLDVAALPSFTPVTSSAVAFMSTSATTGGFETVNVPSLAGDNSFVLAPTQTAHTLMTVAVTECGIADITQWAGYVIDFTSEWSGHWYSAQQAVGAPNVPTAGLDRHGWTAAVPNGTLEHVTLGYDTPVFATGITIHEHHGAGFVYQVDLVDTNDVVRTIWSGTDPSTLDNGIALFELNWETTTYLVKGVRVHIDMDTTGDWEQFDAVELRGRPGPTGQWADTVIDVSSQWSPTGFSAAQALGIPNVLWYRNNSLAWAPANQDGTLEHITVGFPTPVYATGVTVRETWGNGFVYRVDAVDMSDQLHTVWTGADPSVPGSPAEFFIEWPRTAYLVKGVRVHVDTDATTDWEETDAIRLFGFAEEIIDCNGNGVADVCDLLSGTSSDANADGIPDECDIAPNITSVTATPDPVPQGQSVTVTASGVTDANDDVSIMRFYHDANADGALDGADPLLGTDSDAAGGWTWTGSTSGWALGARRLFVRAEDSAGLSSGVASTVLTVGDALDPGTWVGGAGGAWSVGSNWSDGAVPDGATDVTIGAAVNIDAPGAVASSVTLTSGGSLTFSGGGTLSATTVTINSGATLTGVGTITGNVTNGGTVAPGSNVGTLSITGNYTQSASGDLDIDVDGYTPDTQHDVLAVTGTVTFGGALDVTTLGSFVAVDTSIVAFLTAGSTTGAFATEDLPALSGGLSFLAYENAGGAQLVTVSQTSCEASSYRQWASSVISFSSEWSPTAFSAAQTLGPPTVYTYGNDSTAWGASVQNGSLEQLTLGFDVPVYATGVMVRETYGNGFIYQVDVVDTADTLHTVWTGTDPSAPGDPADFLVTWAETAYLVKGVRLYIDTDATPIWEEIDAVELHGVPTETEAWATEVVDFSSEWEPGPYSASQLLGPSNVPAYGNHPKAWAAGQQDGSLEYVTVAFDLPMYATGTTVRETWGNGFVTRVDALDVDGQLHTVWTGSDPSTPGSPADFRINWTQTTYAVRGVRVYVDTDASAVFEEIDSIKLHGIPAPDGAWATRVLSFSSEWSPGVFSAAQAIGRPDVITYGNDALAWAPSSQNGTLEHLEVGYHTPLYADGVTIRESWGSGCVYQVDLLDTDDTYHTIWSGVDPSPAGALANLRLNWTETAYLVKGVKIYVDTDATAQWEEIDAVHLHGRASVVGDCNGNGIADACDIAAGTSLDTNMDGIPDECPSAMMAGDPPGMPALAPTPDDAAAGVTLIMVLDAWGTCGDPADCPADLNGDGYVDQADVDIVLNR